MEPLFDAIVKHIPPPRAHAGEGFQLLVANLDYNDYLGRIAFGKIHEGKVKVGDPAICRHGTGKGFQGKVTMLYHFEGMKRIEIQEAHAGRHRGRGRLRDVFIGETICDSEVRPALPYIPVIRRRFRWNSPSTTVRSPVRTASSSPRATSGIARWGNPHERRAPRRADQRPEDFRGQRARRNADRDPRRADASRRLRSFGVPAEVLWKKDERQSRLNRLELFVEVPSENLGTIMENLSNRKPGSRT